MRVVKAQAAGYQHVVGATGSTGAVYAAVTDDGETVALFRPTRSSGYGKASAVAYVVAPSGRRRRLEGRSCRKLAEFKAWAADDFAGAWVLAKS